MNTINFCQIANLFSEHSESSVLNIQMDEKRAYSFSVEEPDTPLKISESTSNILKEIIGEQRFWRICKQNGIDKIENGTLIVTKEIARKIFVGIADVQKEDFEEISCSLEQQFANLITFNSLKEFELCLMGKGPDISEFNVDKAKSSGKGLQGLLERVYISMQHHFKILEEEDKKAKELRDVEVLTSRLSDRELQSGTVIHLSEGFFYVDQVFVGGGAYATILRNFEEKYPSKLICRGTAMRPTATGRWKSGINDVLLEIGTMGVKHIWPGISKYLNENRIQSIHILGKSLGGAHAQELAILIEGINHVKVDKLTTFCSVGVGDKVNNLFKTEILENRSTPFQIQVVRKGGDITGNEIDYIPSVGGLHLGAEALEDQCKIEVIYIHPGKDEVTVYPRVREKSSTIKNFISSFGVAHCRQTTLDTFNWKIIDNKKAIEEHLRAGNQLEKGRKCLAYSIHALTFGLLNGSSFSSYYKAQTLVSKITST